MKRPGPAPECSNSELITMILVGECRGWDVETELLSYWQEHRDLFPQQPSQSRFNRRRRALTQGINLLRCAILQLLDILLSHTTSIQLDRLHAFQFSHIARLLLPLPQLVDLLFIELKLSFCYASILYQV